MSWGLLSEVMWGQTMFPLLPKSPAPIFLLCPLPKSHWWAFMPVAVGTSLFSRQQQCFQARFCLSPTPFLSTSCTLSPFLSFLMSLSIKLHFEHTVVKF